MPRGGARPGAGRKTRLERYGGDIVRAEDRCRDRLPTTLDNIEKIADGKAVRVEVKRQPAGTIFRKDVVRDKDGHPVADSKGRFVSIEGLSYPDLDPTEMVEVERKETHFAEDLQANQYLADRVMNRLAAGADVPIEEGADGSAPFNLELMDDTDFENLDRIIHKLAYRPPEAGESGAAEAARET